MQQAHRDQLDFQQNLQQDESNRHPQFNESYCGYRCGYGCCEPREGEGDGDSDGGGSESSVDSAGITLVEAPAQNPQSMGPLAQRNFVVKGTPHPEGLPILGEIERRRGLVFLTIIDDFVVVTRNPSSSHLPRIQSFESVFNASMIPDHSSEYLGSRASNGRRTRGVPSPRSPGLGYPTQFDEDIRLHALPPEYHFLQPPLRLSPRDELDQGQLPEGASLWQFLGDMEQLREQRENFWGFD